MSLDANITWQQGPLIAEASFKVQNGITALIGPSGAGKSTLARALTGLHPLLSGEIFLNEKDITKLPTSQRKIGLVMQSPALFPTMSVKDNIFLSATASQQRINSFIKVADIKHLLERSPNKLSGGEAKRVAIVRALAADPEFLIMDEPLAGIDKNRRDGLLKLIKKLNRESAVPILFITHQIEEMLAVADQALLIEAGKIITSGSLEAILNAPQTCHLLGINNLVSLVFANVTKSIDGLYAATIGNQKIWLQNRNDNLENKTVSLRVLASDVAIATKPITNSSIQNIISAEIIEITQSELSATIKCRVPETTNYITSKITRRSLKQLSLKENQTVYLLIKAVAIKDVLPLKA